MYKLAIQLPTSKVYVLCRGSMRQAMEKWEASMPEQIDEILDTGKIHCLTGDITLQNLGLGASELDTLQNEVTLVIHSAANFSLFQDLPGSIRDNCVPIVDLARLLFSFHKIKALLHISTISSKSFLPGGVVLEDADQMSPKEEPATKQLADILNTGQSPYAERFIAPYGQAKYLAEQILLGMQAPFPILIVRPTNIGPAIRDPCPLYGPDGAIPVHTFFQLLFQASERRVWEEMDALPKDIIVDEIPVDIVASTCLLHLAAGSRGIVHAASQLYVQLTGGEYISLVRTCASPALLEKAGRVRVEKNVNFASHANDLLEHASKGFLVDCERSKDLKLTEGPLGLALPGHNTNSFFRKRFARQARSVETWIDSLK
jgi:fatty acyl-CoA reductase